MIGVHLESYTLKLQTALPLCCLCILIVRVLYLEASEVLG